MAQRERHRMLCSQKPIHTRRFVTTIQHFTGRQPIPDRLHESAALFSFFFCAPSS